MALKNVKTTTIKCPECETETVKFDHAKDETFCEKCGLIICRNNKCELKK